MMKKSSPRSIFLLLLTALVWGFGFVAQDMATGSVRAFTFNGTRMALAALVVFLFCLYRDSRGKGDPETGDGVPFRQMTASQKKTLLLGGAFCGLALAVASALQQIGIEQGTSAGKAGFITAMYILFVPLGELLIFRKKLRWLLLPAVLLSVTGLYLLCMKAGAALTLEGGDGTLLRGAQYALSWDAALLGVNLGRVGFLAEGEADALPRLLDKVIRGDYETERRAVLSVLIAEKPSWDEIIRCWVPIAYAGVMSGGVGYTLQIVGQKDTDPTVASLILCLESVFAVLGGWLILGDKMTAREYAGCGMMLIGILLAQWPEKKPAASGSIRP